MGILSSFRKKSVPQELPSLGIDEVNKRIEEANVMATKAGIHAPEIYTSKNNRMIQNLAGRGRRDDEVDPFAPETPQSPEPSPQPETPEHPQPSAPEISEAERLVESVDDRRGAQVTSYKALPVQKHSVREIAQRSDAGRVSDVEQVRREISSKTKEVSAGEEPVEGIPEGKKSKAAELVSDEDGFFKNLVEGVDGGLDNYDDLDDWYKNKFASGDIVHQMRDYWERQKPEFLIKSAGGELKSKLKEKADILHKLEKEWQEIYFSLLSKEEEIRTEERESKALLGEFMDLCKSVTAKANKKPNNTKKK